MAKFLQSEVNMFRPLVYPACKDMYCVNFHLKNVWVTRPEFYSSVFQSEATYINWDGFSGIGN